ncbi:MAG: carboxypeptidase-like regulatory domain-containing protein [Bernardetiaceae bacterium]
MKIWLFFFFPLIVWGQTRGVVYDANDGRPLSGASVFVLEQPELETVTDSLGRFALATTDTRLHLVVSYVGYDEQLVFLTEKPLEVFLAARPAVLEEITIQEKSLVAEEFRIEKISQLEIYTSPLSKADPVLAVQALPASTTLDESAALSLRGGSPAETGVFLNGVPIYDIARFSQINGVGTLSIFNTGLTDRVEVFPSNPPLEFGNTSSGLLAIETQSQLPQERSYGVGINLVGITAQTRQRLGKRIGLIFFGNFTPSFALKGLNPGAFAQIERFQSLDAGVQVFADLKKSTVKLFNYSLKESYTFNQAHPSGPLVYVQDRWRNFTVLSYRYQYQNWEAEGHAGWSYDWFMFGGGNTSLDNRQQDNYLSGSIRYRQERWSLKTGLSWDRRASRASGTVPVFGYALAEQHPSTAYQGRQVADIPEGYVYGKYHLNEGLTLGGGLRQDMTRPHTGWQLNLAKEFGSSHRVIVAVGQYHRVALSRGEGDALLHFRRRQFSLDYRYADKRWEFHQALFRTATQSTIYGSESWIAYKVSKFTGDFSLALLHDAQQPEPRAYFLRLQASYNPTPRLSFGCSGLQRSGTFVVPVVSARFDEQLGVYAPDALDVPERLPYYQIINWNASYLFLLGEGIQVIAFANVSNILDRGNVQALSYNVDYTQRQFSFFSRRTFFVGLELRF